LTGICNIANPSCPIQFGFQTLNLYLRSKN